MDFSYIYNTSILCKEKLIDFGFTKMRANTTNPDKNDDEAFILKKNLNEDFYAVVEISEKKISAEAFESATDEKYYLLDVPSAQGSFVGGLRQIITNIIEEIRQNCFFTDDLKSRYIQWIENELGVKADFPWDDDESSVFRCKNLKWFALVMNIKLKSLGLADESNQSNDESVWAVNLKSDSEKIPELIDGKSVFPAWHMNKKYWITILLTAVTDFEKLKALTLRSKFLVERTSKK